jgi:hypothetical protein
VVACGGDGGDLFGDVEPGERGSVANEVETLVGRVVGAEEDLGAGAAQALARGEEHLADLVPAIGVDGAHVVGERDRVQAHLGVRVRAEEGGALGADGAVAERGALRADRDDAQVARRHMTARTLNVRPPCSTWMRSRRMRTSETLPAFCPSCSVTSGPLSIVRLTCRRSGTEE